MDYIDHLNQPPASGTEDEAFEYPDPETAQGLPWPVDTNPSDVTLTANWDTTLRDASFLSETTSLASEDGSLVLDPNIQFAGFDRFGQPADADYLDQVSPESEGLTSSTESGPSSPEEANPSPRGQGRGRSRGRSRGRPRGSRAGQGRGRGRGRGRSKRGTGSRARGLAHPDEFDDHRRKGRLRKGRGGNRGIRKPVKPSVEFTALHAQANAAFIEDDLETAKSMAEKAISYNPEIFEAHSLLSEIHLAGKDIDRSIMSAFAGAHTRPSDTQNWARAAELMEQIANIVAERDGSESGKGRKGTARPKGRRVRKDALEEEDGDEEEDEDEDEEQGDSEENEKDVEAAHATDYSYDRIASQDHNHDEGEADCQNEVNGDGTMEETAGEESSGETTDKVLAAWYKIRDGKRVEKLPQILDAAVYCYTRALGPDPKNEALRLHRAALNKQRGRFKDSLRDYKRLNEMIPANLEVLRNLAELYMLNNQSSPAIDCVRECMPIIQGMDPNDSDAFGWKDINIFAEVLIWSGQYAQGLSTIKKLSRWMLGRGNDIFWEDLVQDDREFDIAHEPRRIEVLHLGEQNHLLSSYGEGLPLELRIKLGVCRVQLEPNNLREAFMHFGFLTPNRIGKESAVSTFPELFEDVGDAFRVARLYREALQFYEPLKHFQGHGDTRFLKNLSRCYRELGMVGEVEECWRNLLDKKGDDSPKGRTEKIDFLLDADDDSNVIPPLAPELAWRRKRKFKSMAGYDNQGSPTFLDDPARNINPIQVDNEGDATDPPPQPRPQAKTTRKTPRVLPDEEQSDLRPMLRTMQDQKEAMQCGNTEARARWMSNARAMLLQFGKAAVFFPYDRNVRFLGYSTEARARAMASKKRLLEMDMEQAERLKVPLDELPPLRPPPTVYSKVSFDDWLDIFLEYAVLLAEDDRRAACYTILELVTATNVWYHSKESMFLLYVVWAICALTLSDGDKLAMVSRYFMTEYQFVSDTYRFYAALHRIYGRFNLFYNTSATQKYILRQIKAVDWSVSSPERRKELDKQFAERASFAKDENGNDILASDFDIAMLMLYGQLLHAGGSSQEALNYYYRAHALAPEHPLINLSLSVAYAHYGLKRQSLNRQAHISQSLSFLYKYRDERFKSGDLVEKQEAEFNLGRSFQMLGLVHLALPYYHKVLETGKDIRKSWERRGAEKLEQHRLQDTEEDTVMNDYSNNAPNDSGPDEHTRKLDCEDDLFQEDFSIDAAYALQDIYASVGNMEQAQAIIDEYMVL